MFIYRKIDIFEPLTLKNEVMRTRFLTLLALIFVFTLGVAQEIKPQFEKQEDLVKATYFYEDGQVKEIGFFKNDKLHGEWVSFDQEGRKTAIANYAEGLKVGTWYVVTNQSVKELTYESNKLVSVKEVNDLDLNLI